MEKRQERKEGNDERKVDKRKGKRNVEKKRKEGNDLFVGSAP
jgi:hypothetical protein